MWLINGIMTAAPIINMSHCYYNRIWGCDCHTCKWAVKWTTTYELWWSDVISQNVCSCACVMMVIHWFYYYILPMNATDLHHSHSVTARWDRFDLLLSEMNIQHHIRVIDICSHEWIAEFCHMIWSVMPASVTASHLACPQLWLGEAKWVSPWHQGRHNKVFKSGNWALVVEAKQG